MDLYSEVLIVHGDECRPGALVARIEDVGERFRNPGPAALNTTPAQPALGTFRATGRTATRRS